MKGISKLYGLILMIENILSRLIINQETSLNLYPHILDKNTVSRLSYNIGRTFKQYHKYQRYIHIIHYYRKHIEKPYLNTLYVTTAFIQTGFPLVNALEPVPRNTAPERRVTTESVGKRNNFIST